MKFLFNSKYSPVTDGIGFIEDSPIRCARECENWQTSLSHDTKIMGYDGNLESVLRQFFPLYKGQIRKYLFIPTSSNWTAVITGTFLGREISKTKVIAKRLGVRNIQIYAWERNMNRWPNANGWGGGDFIYNGNNEEYRAISLRYEEKWSFDQYGEPLDFEELDVYKKRLIKDRFTPQLLDRYCKHFGIDFFNEDFYMPKGSTAYLVEKVGPLPEWVTEHTLEEARIRCGYE